MFTWLWYITWCSRWNSIRDSTYLEASNFKHKNQLGEFELIFNQIVTRKNSKFWLKSESGLPRFFTRFWPYHDSWVNTKPENLWTDVISKKDMVDKIDPILLLIGTQPEQKIRQICQEEMVRYGVIDSYSVSSNRRGHGWCWHKHDD